MYKLIERSEGLEVLNDTRLSDMGRGLKLYDKRASGGYVAHPR